jgi:hypothetical protein
MSTEHIQRRAAVEDQARSEVGVVRDAVEKLEQALDLLDNRRVESLDHIDNRSTHDLIHSS